MRLAVSNIAWPVEGDETVAAILRAHGVDGIEIAPTKYWPQPLEATLQSLTARRKWWEDQGVKIVAMQALLYGRADLTIFGSAAARRQTHDYLCRVIDMAARLGAHALVFGSPKNRHRGALPLAEAQRIAAEFFCNVGRHAHAQGVHLCVEANPPEYGCDFVVNSREAMELVEQVATDGFGLHLDTGGMVLAQDDPEATLLAAGSRWQHFHISEPYLAPIGSAKTPHTAFQRGLRKAGYDKWISIEMKQPSEADWRCSLIESIRFVRKTYQLYSCQADAA